MFHCWFSHPTTHPYLGQAGEGGLLHSPHEVLRVESEAPLHIELRHVDPQHHLLIAGAAAGAVGRAAQRAAPVIHGESATTQGG